MRSRMYDLVMYFCVDLKEVVASLIEESYIV
jgi:hypothetical protein